MAGTKAGGLKTAATNKAKNPVFYKEIGHAGGIKKVPKGFSLDPDRARIAGTKGGRIPRRPKAVTATQEPGIVLDNRSFIAGLRRKLGV